MRPDYSSWLREQQYDPGTITAQLHRVGRVEEAYGSLDRHFADGTLQSVIDELVYSAEDQRRNKPNPSRIKFNGNTRNNLASYKNAVVLYRKFLTGGWERADADPIPAALNPQMAQPNRDAGIESGDQKLSLERDMQAALRRGIHQLGATLRIVDDGVERSVTSGLIDITCEDERDGTLVVIELKAGKADSRAIGQILGYMGDLVAEEPGREVKGMLVAHDFDQRSLSGARMVPTLELVKYSIEFKFTPVSD